MRFFLIDKVTELVPHERARGVKNVTLTDEVLHDHFPEHPILPGTMILEAIAQLAGFLVEVSLHQPGPRPLRAMLVQVQRARFHRTTGPGDRLEIVATLGPVLDTAAEIAAEVTVDGQRVARAEMTFMLRDVDAPALHEQRRQLYRLWTRDLLPPPEIP